MAAFAEAVRRAMRVLSVSPVGQLGILLPSKRASTPTIAASEDRLMANEMVSITSDPPKRCLDWPERTEDRSDSFNTSRMTTSWLL